MEEINLKKVTSDLSETTPVLLEQTAETALIFKPEIHPGGVRGTLIRIKKNKDESWEQCSELDFRKLTLHEGVKIELRTEQLKKLCEEIAKRQEIIHQGIKPGATSYTVAPSDEVVRVENTNKREIMKQILSNNYSEEFWEMLKENEPELARRLSLSQLYISRREALNEFERSLEEKGLGEERYWQTFFEANKWIFGYGLNYQILAHEESQPHYGGTAVDGTGAQRGDVLTSTSGDVKFTVLVEIKTSATPLLRGAAPQRNGAWSLSNELTDGITQLQANLGVWELEGSRTDANQDRLEGNDIYTVTPKGILLIGRLDQIGAERDKRNTFERFRQGIHAVEILTFDELFKRAEFILQEANS